MLAAGYAGRQLQQPCFLDAVRMGRQRRFATVSVRLVETAIVTAMHSGARIAIRMLVATGHARCINRRRGQTQRARTGDDWPATALMAFSRSPVAVGMINSASNNTTGTKSR
jgi:hypothetical protein